MRLKLIFILFISGFLQNCEITDQREVDSSIINVPATAGGESDESIPVIEVEEQTFDFGLISQGEKVSHSFRIMNSGEADLLITKVEGSCGCTVLKGWPKHPIKPGEKARIDVVFDSSGKSGIQNKSIAIVANTVPSSTMIYLKGEVRAPEIP